MAAGRSENAHSSENVKPEVAVVFKKPVGVPVRRRTFKTVLDEDTYVRELESIIERDFFPSLKRLRVQNDYLEAMSANDNVTMSRLRAQYGSTGGSRPMTGSRREQSPATFETPELRDSKQEDSLNPSIESSSCASEERADSERDYAPEATSVLSLDAYLSTHSSEDNESFEQIMDSCQKRARAQREWLFNTEDAHNERQRALLSSEVPAISDQADTRNQPPQVASWKYRADNELMYPPSGVPLTAAELIEKKAHAGQQVVHAGTRLPSGGCRVDDGSRQQLEQAARDACRRRLQGKVGLDGRDLLSTLAAERKAAAQAGSSTPASDGVSGGDNEQRYGFVRTPSPAPGVEESPLMTWGEIDGTPFRLDGGATPLLGDAASSSAAPSFHMTAPARREQLALRLAEKHSAHHRDKKERALEAARRSVAAASPALSRASLMERLDCLSPAARKLANLGRSSAPGCDNALRRSYTPGRRSSITLNTPTHASDGQTPVASAPFSPSPRHNSSRSASAVQKAVRPSRITDNLLSLPGRKRAVDFF